MHMHCNFPRDTLKSEVLDAPTFVRRLPVIYIESLHHRNIFKRGTLEVQPPQAVDKLNNTVPLSRGYTTAAKLPFSSNCSVPNVGIAMVASSSYEKKLSRRFLTWTNCLASARCVQQFPVVPAPEGGGGGEDPLDGGETILRIESDFFFLCTPSSLQTDALLRAGIMEPEKKKGRRFPTCLQIRTIFVCGEAQTVEHSMLFLLVSLLWFSEKLIIWQHKL